MLLCVHGCLATKCMSLSNKLGFTDCREYLEFLLTGISRIFTGSPTWFFLFFSIFWLVGEREIGIFSMNTKYYHWYYDQLFITLSLFLNHHCYLFILRSERDWFVFSRSEICNIGLSFLEIIQLTCVANWLARFCMVYAGFTWYISDE